jgi:hypothetical protein
LQALIKYLEKELESNNAAQTLKNDNNNNFFGLFGAYSFLHRLTLVQAQGACGKVRTK